MIKHALRVVYTYDSLSLLIVHLRLLQVVILALILKLKGKVSTILLTSDFLRKKSQQTLLYKYCCNAYRRQLIGTLAF